MSITEEELQKQTEYIKKNCSLQTDTVKAIQTANKIFKDSKGSLTSLESEITKEFIDSIIGNMTLNQELLKLADKQNSTGLDVNFVGYLRYITYKTRHIKSQKDIERIEENIQIINDVIEDKQITRKLELKDYGTLYDLQEAKKYLDNFRKKGLIKDGSKLAKLHDIAIKADAALKKLDGEFNKKFTSSPGVIILDNHVKRQQITGKPMAMHNWLSSFYSPHLHAAKVYKKEGQSPKISHLDPSYENKDFDLLHYLYSEVYSVDIEKLIPPDAQECLRHCLGEDWLNQVEKMYSQTERELHDGERSSFNHLTADARKVSAGQMLVAIATGTNTSFFNTSPSDIRDEIYGEGKWKTEANKDRNPRAMLCSEFVGRTLIASLVEVEKQLYKEIERDGTALYIPDKLIEMPLRSNERLHVMTPDRLVSALEEKNAVKKVPVCDIIDKTFNTKDMKQSLSELKDQESKDCSNSESMEIKVNP